MSNSIEQAINNCQILVNQNQSDNKLSLLQGCTNRCEGIPATYVPKLRILLANGTFGNGTGLNALPPNDLIKGAIATFGPEQQLVLAISH
mmetsp:Transcript_40665/g.47579  ORF Transcript_40665/g.47579 Transcript_40665/m.47579 type:complete len:90 (-) Transcript_40665:1721-1990(-)